MKTFEQYINNDPYGEEDWNDIVYEEGDILIANDDIYSGQANQLGHEIILYNKNEEYRITKIVLIMNKETVFVDYEYGMDLPFQIDSVSRYFRKKE